MGLPRGTKPSYPDARHLGGTGPGVTGPVLAPRPTLMVSTTKLHFSMYSACDQTDCSTMKGVSVNGRAQIIVAARFHSGETPLPVSRKGMFDV